LYSLLQPPLRSLCICSSFLLLLFLPSPFLCFLSLFILYLISVSLARYLYPWPEASVLSAFLTV
jgi:hypothetical protein